jgi:uncharacterized membrane protein
MMTAFITVFTYVFQVSDVAVIFTAITFGPWVGLVAGGLGTATADLLGGFAPFAPVTFLAYAGEGLLAGYIALKRPQWLVPAWLAGVSWMVLAYLAGETLLFGWSVAVADLLINNISQAVAGALGVPLYYAVRAAYPPIAQARLGRTWKEI